MIEKRRAYSAVLFFVIFLGILSRIFETGFIILDKYLDYPTESMSPNWIRAPSGMLFHSGNLAVRRSTLWARTSLFPKDDVVRSTWVREIHDKRAQPFIGRRIGLNDLRILWRW